MNVVLRHRPGRHFSAPWDFECKTAQTPQGVSSKKNGPTTNYLVYSPSCGVVFLTCILYRGFAFAQLWAVLSDAFSINYFDWPPPVSSADSHIKIEKDGRVSTNSFQKKGQGIHRNRTRRIPHKLKLKSIHHNLAIGGVVVRGMAVVTVGNNHRHMVGQKRTKVEKRNKS